MPFHVVVCVCEGEDCTRIGPSHVCFCGHAYSSHKFGKSALPKCLQCKCKIFEYVPMRPEEIGKVLSLFEKFCVFGVNCVFSPKVTGGYHDGKASTFINGRQNVNAVGLQAVTILLQNKGEDAHSSSPAINVSCVTGTKSSTRPPLLPGPNVKRRVELLDQHSCH